MLDQFWTPWSNRRDDRWGGSLENRTRMSREVMSRIRTACGEDFIVGLAVNDEPEVEVALKREALAEIIDLHDRDTLMDYVTCGTGSYFDFYKIMPTFLYPEKLGADLAAVLKSTVRHALVTAESHIRTPENAESVLSEGHADLVSIVRGQIADPHLGQQGGGRTPGRHPRLPVLQPDVLGPPLARLLDQLRHQPIGWPRMGMGRRPLHAEPSGRSACWSLAADRPALKRRGWRPSADTASCWPKPRTVLADSSAWPACSRAARRSST